MKKLLYCAAAFASLLFAASCQQEELAPAVDNSTVTFTVEAPASFQTKAIADGQNVDQLVYEVWLTETLGDLTNGAEKLYQATADMVSDGKVNKATLTLDLVKNQKFTVLFWAQVESAAAYNTEELTAVTYAKDAYNSNDEGLAAFYSVAYVDDNKPVTKEGNATTGNVVLRRPFAQLNLGTLNTAIYDVKVLKSEVTVSDVNTVFNVATNVASEAESMTFDMAEVPADPTTITVNGVEYVYVAMNYVFASDNATVKYDLETSIKGNTTNVINEVTSVPLKENYRTNIIGNLLTGNTDFDIIVDEGFAGDENKDANTDYVTNDAELAAALKQDKRDIIIDLAQEEVTKATTPKTYNVQISANTDKFYFGGETTRTITINANGNTINFVHNNSDWNYIRCVNDAVVWTINNAALTNSEHNDGPWNRHDISFYNSVVLNDVTSDKAIALLNDGKLNNVTITETTGAYGLWITADGQTVDIDGLSVTATNDGRGIAIKDQYVESPAKVTLNVADAEFTTSTKAAVLVTSTAGAVINWGKGNDISAVAADPINAVWVDEDRAQYASEVEVNGATLAIEGQVEICTVSTTEELVAALKDGESYIYLEAGNYALAQPAIAASNVIIYGKDRENCVITLTKQLRATDGVTVLTLKNLTLDVPTGLGYTEHTFAWIHYLKEFNMVDCNSNGRVRLNTNSANIEGCNFEVTTSSGFDGYAIQYQGANNSNTTVKDCVFNTAGKAIVMYNEGKPVLNLDVENCTFNSSDASTDKAAVQMHTEYGISGTLDIINCTATGFADVNDGLWNELNNSTKKPTQKFTITVDGNTVQQAIPEGYTEVAAGLYKNGVKYLVSSAEGLQKMNEMFADKSAGRDAVLELHADIDFAGKTWTPVDSHADAAFEIAEINGNGHTISNMTIDGQAMFSRFAGSGDVVVKDITFDNATVNSTAINTSILTGQSYQNVLLDNVDVKNSAITGSYKVAPLIATVYNESSSTVTATLKNCDVENVTVKATSYDFCTAGMVAFVYADNNDKIEFENCTVKDVKLYAPDDSYKAHAAVYTTGSEGLYNEAEGVTVTNVTFEAL